MENFVPLLYNENPSGNFELFFPVLDNIPENKIPACWSKNVFCVFRFAQA